MNEAAFQESRAESSSKVLSVVTRFDPKAKQFVVRWKDFQHCFENVKRIMNEETAGLFVTDDGLQSSPPLTFTPGLVFKVLVTDNEGSSSLTGVPDSTPDYEASQSIKVDSSNNTQSSSMITRDVIYSMENDTDNQSLAAHSQGLPSRIPTPLTASGDLGAAFRHGILTPCQVNAGTSIPFSDGQIDIIQWEMGIDMAQQEQLHRPQQQMDTALQEVQQCGDILQEMQHADLQTHGTQTQQSILQKVHQMDHNTQRSLQPVHEMDENERRRVLSSPQQTPTNGSQDYPLESLWIQKQGFEHFMVILSRARALLAKSFEELPMPRLFIVLPKAIGIVDGHGDPLLAQFRFYYLCECGAHTAVSVFKEAHKIHIANHPGYDLDNHDEFFDKYGRYLLVMMYMVKCGVSSAGREVPPLLNLMAAETINVNPDHLEFDKENIGRLVDDTITYLEGRIRIKDRDIDPTSQWELHPSELTSLESYLNRTEDGSVSGHLHQMQTQERQCIWICSKHQQEYHESTIQVMKEFILSNDEECNYDKTGNTIVIQSESDWVEDCFCDAMSNVRWIQNSNNQRSLTALDLRLLCDDWIPTSAQIIISLNAITTLKLYFKRLLLSVDIDENGSRYIKVESFRSETLTSKEYEFIEGCHHTHLSLSRIPLGAECHLVDNIRNSPNLEDLHMDCSINELITIINLVLSTRERAIQDGVSHSLRTFTTSACCVNDRCYVNSKVTFFRNSQLFDMRTSVRFLGGVPDDDLLGDFLCQYGWSIRDLEVLRNFDDQLAAMLWNSIQAWSSKIKNFSVDPNSLTTSGLNILDRIIRILPRSTVVQLEFNNMNFKHRLENTLQLLRLCKDRVNHLALFGDSMDTWLPRLAQEFPDRTSFPVLGSFSVGCYDYLSEGPEVYVPWIVTMISTPADQILPSTRLEMVRLDASLQRADWRTLIETLDLSTLKELIVEQSNFSFTELELLVNRIVDSDASQVRPATVRINSVLYESEVAQALCTRLYEKAPDMQIRDW